MVPMKFLRKPLYKLLAILFWISTVGGAFGASAPRYLVTNEDQANGNSATIYTMGTGGTLTTTASIPTGGFGWNGNGPVASNKVLVSNDANGDCAYLSDFVSIGGFAYPDVTGISLRSLTVAGNFLSSNFDQATQGMALAGNASYLYAYFNSSENIGTYQKLPGCKLNFLQDTPASGLNGGTVVGMHVSNQILVMTFSDGSIESFNLASGVAVSNGDLQISTAHAQFGYWPGPVDITSDSHFAIIGDTGSMVEVSDLSSGKLAPPVLYSGLGTGQDSGGIWLSPDQTLLYLSDFDAGRISAARFDKLTGTPSRGCISSTLKGHNRLWSWIASLATLNTTGTGSAIYAAEPDRYIAGVQIAPSGGGCTITEFASSPTYDANAWTLESIGIFPPRNF